MSDILHDLLMAVEGAVRREVGWGGWYSGGKGQRGGDGCQEFESEHVVTGREEGCSA